MTITTILTILLGIISIVFSFVLGRHSVTRKIKKIKRKMKLQRGSKKAKKTVKVKKERKPRKKIVADPVKAAELEQAFNQASQNNELVPVTKTVKA